MDPDRDRLRDLSERLLKLHRVLLDRERVAYETRHGSVAAGDLFRLVLDDPQFAWLRSLSALIARIAPYVKSVGTDGLYYVVEDMVAQPQSNA